MEPELEVIAEGLGFPEGPVVMPDGSVIVMEMLGRRISRCWRGRKEVVAEIEGGPNGAQLGPDGALYICNNGGREGLVAFGGGRLERLDLATGKLERLYDTVDGRKLDAPNDIVFDREGGAWFTDIGHMGAESFTLAGLYYCRPDGSSIRRVHFGGMGYNGVGLSPAEDQVYVASTFTGRLYRFGLSGPGQLSGELGSKGSPEIYVGAAPADAWCDSLAVTAAGTVCVATIMAGGIASFTPGGEMSFLKLPDEVVTNIAFGGEDMRDAYITLSGSGRLAKMRWPEPGLKLNFGA
jgi:gluconolactonase